MSSSTIQNGGTPGMNGIAAMTMAKMMREAAASSRQSFSSSTAGAASERSTSTGRISVKTMTSLKLLA